MAAIAEVERNKTEEQTAQGKFCTIKTDGSTDVFVLENEIVYRCSIMSFSWTY